MRRHLQIAVLLAIVLVVAVAAGCGGSSGTTPESKKPASSGKVYTKANPDITTKVGESFTIELASNASTGYHWELTGPLSPAVVKVSDTYVPGKSAEGQVGVPGTEQWVFKGASPGQALIQMEYMPPGTGEPAAETVTFNVTVQ